MHSSSSMQSVSSALLVVLVAALAADCQQIVFPNKKACPSEECVALSQCPSLKPATGVRLTYEDASALQSKKCGFAGSQLKVCCPDKRTATITATTTSSTTPSTTHAPTPTPTPAPTWVTDLPLQCGHQVDLDRIHGGKNARLGAHPWMVAIGYQEPVPGRAGVIVKFKCGGSLVTQRHVVTAAHCVHPAQTGGQAVAQLNIGEWNTQTDPDCISISAGNQVCAPPVVVRSPAKVTWHPNYNSNRRHNNDIAVIRLNQDVQFSFFLQPICIPATFDPHSDSSRRHPAALATGWGSTETGVSSDILQELRLPFVDLLTCNTSYRMQLSEHQLCAGGVKGKDTCFGDSGGPLITTGRAGPPYILVGLTSFGKGICGQGGNYGVYTSVAYYRKWVVDALRL